MRACFHSPLSPRANHRALRSCALEQLARPQAVHSRAAAVWGLAPSQAVHGRTALGWRCRGRTVATPNDRATTGEHAAAAWAKRHRGPCHACSEYAASSPRAPARRRDLQKRAQLLPWSHPDGGVRRRRRILLLILLLVIPDNIMQCLRVRWLLRAHTHSAASLRRRAHRPTLSTFHLARGCVAIA